MLHIQIVDKNVGDHHYGQLQMTVWKKGWQIVWHVETLTRYILWLQAVSKSDGPCRS